MKELVCENSGKLVLIDDNIYEKLVNLKIWLTSSNYPYIRGATGKDTILLSRLILGLEPFDRKYAEHKNKNPLDNRLENLEIFTPTQNQQNRAKSTSKCLSKYKGVSFDKSRNKWAAKICINYKTKNLGRFMTETEAALAYNEAAIKYFTNPLLNVL